MSGAAESNNGPQLQAASPPSRRDLKSWWKGFKLPSKQQETQGIATSSNAAHPYTALTGPVFSEDMQDQVDDIPPLLRHILHMHDHHVSQFGPVASSDASRIALFAPFVPFAARLTRSLPLQPFSQSPRPNAFLLVVKRLLKTKQAPVIETGRSQGIFGVPLRQSITYANVAISLIDENGKSYIYGYVPIVVAKCGVFLKEKATGIEGIFRLSGSEKRIKELKNVFDSGPRYGKGLVWEGYTVHDAANVLRRYLNDLPEPVVPLDLYQKFREPLRGATKQAVGDAEGPQLIEGFDEQTAIVKYEQLIKALPPLNRQLLLYILDLLAVFAAKSDENRMTSQNLAAIFQPGMLSHPDHAMAPEEYRLNQCVIIFLIENQDHFLIGMQGTATDDKTMEEIEKGTPPVSVPTTPTPNRRSTINRSASNASAGAESVRRDGKLRRNRSTSSRHSHQDGASTPHSPGGLIATPNSGLGRSNTVPSKKSPNLQAGRFHKHDVSPLSSPRVPALQEVITPATPNEQSDPNERSLAARTLPVSGGSGSLAPTSAPGSNRDRSQERLLDPSQDPITPQKERNLQSIFQRSPSGETSEKRQPNKLKKKRIPGSVNPSAQSSSTSLQGSYSGAPSPSFEAANPMDTIPATSEARNHTQEHNQMYLNADTTPRASHITGANAPHSESGLRRKKSQASLHSSFNEGSDMEQMDERGNLSSTETAEKEKRHRWRISRSRKDDVGNSPPEVHHPRAALGVNNHAEGSMTSIGSSGQRPRKSFTGESSDVGTGSDIFAAYEYRENGKEESRGPLGWIRNKYREHKETAEQRRTKSPPGDGRQPSGLSASVLPMRGKSLDIKREDQRPAIHPPVPQQVQPVQGQQQSVPQHVQPVQGQHVQQAQGQHVQQAQGQYVQQPAQEQQQIPAQAPAQAATQAPATSSTVPTSLPDTTVDEKPTQPPTVVEEHEENVK